MHVGKQHNLYTLHHCALQGQKGRAGPLGQYKLPTALGAQPISPKRTAPQYSFSHVDRLPVSHRSLCMGVAVSSHFFVSPSVISLYPSLPFSMGLTCQSTVAHGLHCAACSCTCSTKGES